MAQQFYDHIDLNQNELREAIIEPLTTAPASPKAGQIYFNTTDIALYQYNGTTWINLYDKYTKAEVDSKISQIQTDLSNEVTRAKDEEARIEGKVDSVQGEVDGAKSSTAKGVDSNNDGIVEPKIFTSVDARIEELEGDVKTDVKNLSDYKTANDDRVATIETEVSTARGGQTSLDARLDTMDTKNTNQDTTLTDHGTRISNVESEITTARGTSTSLDARLDAIDTDGSSQNTRITDLETEVSNARNGKLTLDTRLDAMDAKNTNQDTRLTDVESKASATENEVTTARGTDVSLDARLDAVDTKNSGQDTKISNLETEVTTARGTETSLDARMDTMDSKNGVQDTRIGDLETEVQTARGTSTTLDARLDAMDTANSTQNTDITNLKSDKLNIAGGTMTGALTLNADPTQNLHAATKQYVDALKQGLDVKDSVRAALDTNIELVPATKRTGLTVDGVALNAGDRVLLMAQTAGAENGIYVVETDFDLVRSSDADTDTEVTSGMFTFVVEGSKYASNGFVLSTPDPITLGTTALTFSQFSGAGQVVPGEGLSKTGNEIYVDVATASSLGSILSGGDISVDATGLVSVLDDSHNHVISNVDGLQTALDAKVDDTEVVTTATPGKLLKLDANSKLPASITGNTDGNAATASKLATGRVIQLAGDVTGSVTFDGSLDVSITAAVVDDSHNHIISNVDGLQTALDGKQKAITQGTTAPTNPVDGELWLDETVVPNILKKWEGSFATPVWVKVTPTIPDEIGAAASSDLGTITNLNTIDKASAVGGINELFNPYTVSKTNKDTNGIFLDVTYKRISDATIYQTTNLSNPDINGNYQTLTKKFFTPADQVTAVRTETWTLTYDVDGDITGTAVTIS